MSWADEQHRRAWEQRIALRGPRYVSAPEPCDCDECIDNDPDEKHSAKCRCADCSAYAADVAYDAWKDRDIR